MASRGSCPRHRRDRRRRPAAAARQGSHRRRAARALTRGSARCDRRCPCAHHPVGDQGDVRRAAGCERPRRRRTCGHRPRQRRRRSRDSSRCDGRERAAVERAVRCRAHAGAAARAGPQHPASARGLEGRSVGAHPVGRRRAERQGARASSASGGSGSSSRSGRSRSACACSRTTPSSRPTAAGR